MVRITVTCALIFIALGFHQGVEGEKPWMEPEEEVLDIREGEELKIECISNERVHFSRMKFSKNIQQSEYLTRNDSYSGVYTFIIPRTSHTDTGWYACADEGIEIRNDEQVIDHSSDDIRWIYVYVNSEVPFADMTPIYETVVIPADSDGVIPCRPTSSRSEVVLEMSDDTTLVPEDMEYDSRIGFIMRNVGRERTGQSWMCKIKGIADELWPSYYVSVIDSQITKTPMIHRDKLLHVVWGQNLTLNCSITLSPAEIVHFDLQWRAPSSVPKNRIKHSEQKTTSENNDGQSAREVAVTIIDIEESDAGEYICLAKTPGHEEQASIDIRVWDPDYTYVNLTVDGLNEIVSNESAIAKWKIMIETYPENFYLEWLKPDGTNITEIGETETDKYSHTVNGITHIFRISNLNVEDSGQYTIRVSTSTDVSNITLLLTVEAPPRASIEKNSSPYKRKKPAILFCNTCGSPLPNVTWSYTEYPEFPSRENPVHKSLSKNIHNEPGHDHPYHLLSRLNITINAPGELTCRSCNEFGCTEATELITVSDADIFGIRGPKLVAEGDNVTLICTASRENFTDTISWRPKPDNGRIQVFHDSENLTVRSELELLNVDKSNSGIYSCLAESKTRGNKTENHTLDVQSAHEPEINYANFNNSEILIKYKDISKNMTLTCNAVGVPIPRVTWHKNEKLLVSGNQYEISSDNSTLYIRLFREKDSGRYTCRAENRLGHASHSVDIKIEGAPAHPQSNTLWIVLIILIIIIVIVITYMGIKVHRERAFRKELLEAGLAHFEEGALESLNPDLTLDDQVELLPYDKKWEFPRERLKLGKQLGSGAFGVVMKAEAQGIIVEGEVTTVAVKMVRRSADPSYMKALSSELKIMIHLGRHMNVVNLLGACTKTILTKRELYVIVEYCRFGNLHNYLQRHRDSFINQIDPSSQKIDPTFGLDRLDTRLSVGSQNKSKYTRRSFSASDSINSSDSNNSIQLIDYHLGQNSESINMSPDGGILSNNSSQPGWRSNYRGDYKDQNLKPICTQDLLCWAWQVSRGMEYLSARNVLHGDLAARNILLADDNVVKICDFGLAKNMYKDDNYKKKGDCPLPIKWMAIESIRDRIFSTQSDVWSFGIVLWEFFTLARTPYPGMEAETQYDRLMGGYRMEKPEFATKEIYNFMLNCWQADPSLRPTFHELAEQIGSLLTDGVKTHFSNLNTPYVNMNIEASQNGQSDYLTMMSAPNHRHHNSHNPLVEVHGDSAYVSMNRAQQSSQSTDLTPTLDAGESLSAFPYSNQNTLIHLDPVDCDDAKVPMLTTQNSYAKFPNDQRVRTEGVNRDKERDQIGSRSGSCSFVANTDYANLEINQSSGVYKNLDPISGKTKSRVNNTNEYSPSAVTGKLSRGNNIPRLKIPDRFGGDKVDSFSNPGYVHMSAKQLEASEL